MVSSRPDGDLTAVAPPAGGRPEGLPITEPSATRVERAALRVLQAGAVLVIIIASTNKAYELDRFFVPKEFVLHLTAFCAALLAAEAFRRVRLTRTDLLLLGFLVLSGVSAVLASDRPLAFRAMAISVSGIAVFWAARAIREAGLARPLLSALALAVVIGCVTSLLQTYGAQTELFSVNRAPGGTLGNRNFIAHLAAFGLPVVLYCALHAWRAIGYLLWTTGAVLVAGTLILTRSRAGWLAAAAVVLILGASMLLSPPLRRHGRSWRRLTGILILAAAGVAGSLLVPNTLRWRSDSPYLESVRELTNYQEGSGRGRLVQYGRSMQMAMDRPLLGVGPGNWAPEYPDYAAPGDPSLSRTQPGTTANPWPSSDWVAFVSERGFPAASLLALAFVGLAFRGFRRIVQARDAEEGLAGAALLATVAATVIAGALDAVLLLGLPALIVWAALGVLWSDEPGHRPRRPWPGRVAAIVLVLLALGAGTGAFLSAVDLAAIGF
jgi:hypothetical protein